MPESFHFSDLRELFAKANEEKSGDQLAGIAARSERERVAAKILRHLGLPARAPPRGRPWRPGQQQLALRDDADRFDAVDPPVTDD